MSRTLYFCGDIHGEFNLLVWTALYRYGIKNADIVILGDFGVGFDDSLNSVYNRNKEKLEKSDVTIWSIRGNHDDPKYFKGGYDFPRLKFIEDYKVIDICDRKILPIGGACSTDITWRLKKNKESEHWGSHRRVWWPDEGVEILESINRLPTKVDIIISHTAPIIFDPIPSRFDDCPEEQYEKILEERKYLNTILEHTTTDYWYYGHFHNSLSGEYCNTMWRCLDIMEIYESKPNHIINPQGEDTIEKAENLINENNE